jgi:hypothetical protein
MLTEEQKALWQLFSEGSLDRRELWKLLPNHLQHFLLPYSIA